MGEPCSGLATAFLQEFLKTPLTGQAVFKVAAEELKSTLDALSDEARCASYLMYMSYSTACCIPVAGREVVATDSMT